MEHEEFLNAFFTQVSQLNFDKAKEIVDRERELSHQSQSGPWGVLLIHLPHLAMAEKSYMDIGFLQTKNKGFLRKDNSLRSIYDSLRGEFRRLEDMTRITGSDNTVSTLCSQLSQFSAARIELIDFYEKMYVMSNGKHMKQEELVSQLQDIVQKHSLSFSHMSLATVKATLSLECEILVHLLKSHVEMQAWNFLSSLMMLHGAHTRLSAWERSLQNRESWKLGFGATFLKANQFPQLFQWLVKLKAAFVAKFSLYFYTTLSSQTSAQEMKTLCGKLSNDYFHKITTFQRRYDAAAVSIVFDATGMNFSGAGYQHPNRQPETFQGLDCYHIIVYYPIKPVNHMQNIVQVLTERASDLAAMERVVYYFSHRDQCTYILSRVDPRMTLVVIFDMKKVEKETHITNFVQDLSSQLRCNSVFLNLKLNSR